MELDDLKKIWATQDKRLEENLKVNAQLLKMTTLQKTKGLLADYKSNEIIELVVNGVFLMMMLGLLVDNFGIAKWMIPVLILSVGTAINLFWNIYGLRELHLIQYETPITVIQKKIERLRYYSILKTKLLLVIIPFFWICFLIVFFKFILQLDYFVYATWLWYNLIATMVISIVIVWLMLKFPDKNMENALNFLNEIKDFEREEIN